MKRFMYFAILASAAFCVGQTAHVSQDEEAVRKFVDDFSTAFSQNDAAALDRMTAPDYTFVTPTGTIQNKEQRVAPIRSGDLKYDYAKYDEIKVRIYGEMAIVTAHVTVKSELKGGIPQWTVPFYFNFVKGERDVGTRCLTGKCDQLIEIVHE
jgi:ketosteroid isomerase-like protein